jgi:hypothetical protein
MEEHKEHHKDHKEHKEEHHEHHDHNENHEHHEHHSKNNKSNPWIVASVILAILVIVLGYMAFFNKPTVTIVPGDQAGKKLVDFLNVKTQGGVDYVSNKDMGNLYEVTVSYQSQEIPVYITKDGKYFVQAPVPLDEQSLTPECTTDAECAPTETCQAGTCVPKPQEVPKSDKPKVELFVMTHCPYGTQAEKGFIPAMKALGTKVDAKIRFVHYFMHGDNEEAETYNQVCIREEQSAKFLPYLECFLATTGSADDSKKCLDTAKIDKTKLNTCLSNDKKKAKEYYDVDKKLSEQYGVQGSPTLIVNGVQSNSGRDSQSMLKTMCGAFTTAPTTECTKTLSTANPSPGFGTGTAAASGAASNAGCATV